MLRCWLWAAVFWHGDYYHPLNKISPTSLPDINFPDVSGNFHSISEWRGKILIINFWATWCPPCLKEIPEFIALQEQYSDIGLQFIGIAIDDQDSVQEYLALNQNQLPDINRRCNRNSSGSTTGK